MTDSVPWEVRKERAKLLRALSDERYDTRASEQVGEIKKVLLLKPKDQFVRSVSQDYWDVFLENRGDLKQGQIQEVKINGYERVQMGRTKGFLTGVVL
jgi:tRNA A37 methylthiotransferase MiaB